MAYEAVYNGLVDYLPDSYSQAIAGGLTGAALAFLGALALVFWVAVYVYHAWAWMRIGKNMKYKYPWLAWIPFAGSAMRLQLGGFHWAWIFLLLIPVFGWLAVIVLLTISIWRVFENQKYPGWLALAFPLMFVPKIDVAGIIYLIVIGLVAWRKKSRGRKKGGKRKKRKKRK